MAHLLSPDDEKRIAALVAEVEARTAGELVTLVAARSDDYALVRALWAGLLAIGGGLAAHLLWPDLSPDLVFTAQAPVAILGYLLFGPAPLLRKVLPKELAQRAVDARAKQLFLEHGVTETRDRSGILIFLSELEHRVTILADRGIHQRLGDAEWQRDVAAIVDAIHAGRAADGICDVITRLGHELEQAFPPRDDDENELDDRVRRV